MKKKNLNSLKLNKAPISNLQVLHGGSEEEQQQANNPAEEEAADILSIGKVCSKNNTCRRVCCHDSVDS